MRDIPSTEFSTKESPDYYFFRLEVNAFFCVFRREMKINVKENEKNGLLSNF